MLPKFYEKIGDGCLPWIRKYADGKDVSDRGAFPLGTSLRISTFVSRRLGASAVVLRFMPDGKEATDLPLSFVGTNRDVDEYAVTLSFSEKLVGGEDGLFFYEFLFLRGCETLFTNSINNVDFTLSDTPAEKFRLLIYQKNFAVPEWFAGGTMYHVFVDRFCRGAGEIVTRADAVMESDWEHGVPPYPEKSGDPLENNVFFGGNLAGVVEKLDYLVSLGVTVIYLSPIFKAYSNHKYDTGDYETVDPMFGGDKALDDLISKAHERGIRVILDGVFNHTGDDSRYFNRYGKYDSVGAYQSPASPYADWYCFKHFPDKYECWWGIPILPKLNLNCRICRDYFVGENGITGKYLDRGIGGWRLDVADELSDDFLDALRKNVKQHSQSEGVIIGEVWENAADKIAYGKRRRYFQGAQLDSVMNYPVRNAILAFVLKGDADRFYNTLTELYSSYPPQVCDSLMNLLGTHDTERILTMLGEAPLESLSNRELAFFRLDSVSRELAVRRLMVASVLQFTIFGVPSVYYGDEVGMEGGHDPFCRMPFPWGHEDGCLLSHYRFLGRLRHEHRELRHGKMRFVAHREYFVAYERSDENGTLLILANCGNQAVHFALTGSVVDVKSQKEYTDGVMVAPVSAMILKYR